MKSKEYGYQIKKDEFIDLYQEGLDPSEALKGMYAVDLASTSSLNIYYRTYNGRILHRRLANIIRSSKSSAWSEMAGRYFR